MVTRFENALIGSSCCKFRKISGASLFLSPSICFWMKSDKDLNIRDSFLLVTCGLLVGYTWLRVEILNF